MESTEAAEELAKLFDCLYAPGIIQAGHCSTWFVCQEVCQILEY